MKRFWTTAEPLVLGRSQNRLVQGEPVSERQWGVSLDGKPLRLPGGAVLFTASHALAAAIATEWAAAGGGMGGVFTPDHLPLTGLAGAAQERVAADPAAMLAGLVRYAETDLLCYRAPEPSLAARQAQAWQPLLDWAADQRGVRLCVTEGIMPVAQPPASLQALHDWCSTFDTATLAALGVMVPALGSAILGLAVQAGRLDAAGAHTLALLDETAQAERWGNDADAASRRQRLGAEIADAARFLALHREGVAQRGSSA